MSPSSHEIGEPRSAARARSAGARILPCMPRARDDIDRIKHRGDFVNPGGKPLLHPDGRGSPRARYPVRGVRSFSAMRSTARTPAAGRPSSGRAPVTAGMQKTRGVVLLVARDQRLEDDVGADAQLPGDGGGVRVLVARRVDRQPRRECPRPSRIRIALVFLPPGWSMRSPDGMSRSAAPRGRGTGGWPRKRALAPAACTGPRDSCTLPPGHAGAWHRKWSGTRPGASPERQESVPRSWMRFPGRAVAFAAAGPWRAARSRPAGRGTAAGFSAPALVADEVHVSFSANRACVRSAAASGQASRCA